MVEKTEIKLSFLFCEVGAYLSTSGVLLICGEAALAGEKLGLYRPDMALAFEDSFKKPKKWNFG